MNLGTIGKLKVAVKFLELGYDVFNELDGKSPFDLVIHHEGDLKRVEVKSSSTRNSANSGWVVQLKKVRHNKTQNKIVLFDSGKMDLLGVFIDPIDKVIIIDSKNISVTAELSIFDKDIAAYEYSTEEMRVFSEVTEEDNKEASNILF